MLALQQQQQQLLDMQKQLRDEEAAEIHQNRDDQPKSFLEFQKKMLGDGKHMSGIDQETESRVRYEHDLRRKIEEEYSHRERRDSNMSAVDAIRSLGFKRELKIQGTIGGRKDTRLNYISLQSQVSEATKRGYSDEDITFALRRAVAPESELRQYLDALDSDISLEEVLEYIRGAYKEKAASELFHDLNKLCQNSTEENQAFLFRALSLRQKMIAASKIEDSIDYSVDLIQSVFKRSVLTGLREDAVRAHMKSCLSPSSKKTDRELIDEISKVSAEETEHILKQGGSCNRSDRGCNIGTAAATGGAERRARVNQVTFNDAVGDESSRSTDYAAKAYEVTHRHIESQINSVVKPLTDTIKDLTLQLSEMQKELEEMKKRRQSATPRHKRLGCKECLAKKIMCKHCFKCGQDGHRIASCPNSSTSN